jgi:pimeloyl-ACP methyl ester carboxylesterase
MLRIVTGLAVVAALVYLALAASVYVRQRQLIYFPVPEADVEDLEALWLDRDEVRLKMWRVNPGHERALVYFGGNAEDVSYAAAPFAAAFPDYTIYLLNYRGYGGSSGSPTEQGFLADGLAAFDHAAEAHLGVAVIGRSIGSAVAVHTAAYRPVLRLALVTPFDSIEAIARRHYPLLPVSWLLKDKYRAIDAAPAVEAPTLVVIAGRDRVVPRSHSERLVEALGSGEVVVRVLEEDDHDGIGRSGDYLETLGAFFASGH